jgi:hypothetical protein
LLGGSSPEAAQTLACIGQSASLQDEPPGETPPFIRPDVETPEVVDKKYMP